MLALNKPEYCYIAMGVIAAAISGGIYPTFAIIFGKVIGVRFFFFLVTIIVPKVTTLKVLLLFFHYKLIDFYSDYSHSVLLIRMKEVKEQFYCL